MKRLLMQLGWTAYQAQCLTPWLWAFVLAGACAGFAGLIGAIMEANSNEQD